MQWYGWIVVSVLLLVAELLTPGTFVSFFFAVGALITGLVVWFEIATLDWLQITVFIVGSVTSYLLFHPQRWSLTGGISRTDRDSIVGETVVSKEIIPPLTYGKVSYRGSIWNAYNLGPQTIHPTSFCLVTGLRGLTLEISSIPTFITRTSNQ